MCNSVILQFSRKEASLSDRDGTVKCWTPWRLRRRECTEGWSERSTRTAGNYCERDAMWCDRVICVWHDQRYGYSDSFTKKKTNCRYSTTTASDILRLNLSLFSLRGSSRQFGSKFSFRKKNGYMSFGSILLIEKWWEFNSRIVKRFDS
jgi:hypothetical protein